MGDSLKGEANKMPVLPAASLPNLSLAPLSRALQLELRVTKTSNSITSSPPPLWSFNYSRQIASGRQAAGGETWRSASHLA